jgi:hypothetical protein
LDLINDLGFSDMTRITIETLVDNRWEKNWPNLFQLWII